MRRMDGWMASTVIDRLLFDRLKFLKCLDRKICWNFLGILQYGWDGMDGWTGIMQLYAEKINRNARVSQMRSGSFR